MTCSTCEDPLWQNSELKVEENIWNPHVSRVAVSNGHKATKAYCGHIDLADDCRTLCIDTFRLVPVCRSWRLREINRRSSALFMSNDANTPIGYMFNTDRRMNAEQRFRWRWLLIANDGFQASTEHRRQYLSNEANTSNRLSADWRTDGGQRLLWSSTRSPQNNVHRLDDAGCWSPVTASKQHQNIVTILITRTQSHVAMRQMLKFLFGTPPVFHDAD